MASSKKGAHLQQTLGGREGEGADAPSAPPPPFLAPEGLNIGKYLRTACLIEHLFIILFQTVCDDGIFWTLLVAKLIFFIFAVPLLCFPS